MSFWQKIYGGLLNLLQKEPTSADRAVAGFFFVFHEVQTNDHGIYEEKSLESLLQKYCTFGKNFVNDSQNIYSPHDPLNTPYTEEAFLHPGNETDIKKQALDLHLSGVDEIGKKIAYESISSISVKETPFFIDFKIMHRSGKETSRPFQKLLYKLQNSEDSHALLKMAGLHTDLTKPDFSAPGDHRDAVRNYLGQVQGGLLSLIDGFQDTVQKMITTPQRQSGKTLNEQYAEEISKLDSLIEEGEQKLLDTVRENKKQMFGAL